MTLPIIKKKGEEKITPRKGFNFEAWLKEKYDRGVFKRGAPSDLSINHDKYLYNEYVDAK